MEKKWDTLYEQIGRIDTLLAGRRSQALVVAAVSAVSSLRRWAQQQRPGSPRRAALNTFRALLCLAELEDLRGCSEGVPLPGFYGKGGGDHV
jgi:hypothetical protein